MASTEDDADRVLFALVRVMDAIRRGQARVIDPTRQALMQAAATHGPIRPSELARDVNLAQSSVTRQVRALEDDGFVVVEPDPDDGRSCLVSLSPQGWAEARRLTEMGRSRMQQTFAGWAATDVATLADLLERMEASGRQARERARPASGRRWQRRDASS